MLNLRNARTVRTLFWAVVLVWPGATQSAELRDVRLGKHDLSTHVVIEADAPFCANIALASKPYRLILDLGAIQGPRPEPKPLGFVAKASWAPNPQGRLILELKSPARVADLFVVAAKDGKGFRRVLKLESVPPQDFAEAQAGLPKLAGVIACAGGAAKEQAQRQAGLPAPPPSSKPSPAPSPGPSPKPSLGPSAGPSPGPAPAKTAAANPAIQTPAKPIPPVANPVVQAAAPVPQNQQAPPASRVPRDRKWTVVIDPGHGGDDPGAIGPSGVLEKDLTLAMARVMKKKLEATGRYRVELTRGDDRFMALRERTAFADRDDAHLFVSLHADTIAAPNVRGVSVYTLSDKASDAESEALAAKENAADKGNGAGAASGLDLLNPDLRFRLEFDDIGPIARPFRKLAIEELRRAEIETLPTPDRSAGFVVLKTRKVPSVLIEMGYLSNAADEKLLRQSRHQERFAQALIKAADRFFACPEVWKWFAGSEDNPVTGRGVSCGASLAEGTR